MSENQIIIHRKKELWDPRNFKVFIDGECIGIVKNGETQTFSVDSGRHVVNIKQVTLYTGSKDYYIPVNSSYPVFLDVSLSFISILAHAIAIGVMLGFAIDAYTSLFAGTVFMCLLLAVLFCTILFIAFSNRFINIRATARSVRVSVN